MVVVSASELSLYSFLASCSGKDDSIDSIFIAAVAMEEEEGEDANEKVENSADAAVTLRRVVRAVRGLLALSPPLESFLRDLVMVLISEVNSSAKQGGTKLFPARVGLYNFYCGRHGGKDKISEMASFSIFFKNAEIIQKSRES